MENKQNYNNFFNRNNKPAETPNTPAEEIKELDPIVNEGDESVNPEAPVVGSENNEGLDANDNPEIDETKSEGEEDDNSTEPEAPVSETKNVQLVKVTVASLNIRNTASKDSDIITVVNKDDELELRESTSIDGFYAVKTNNGTFGYCMVDFVELV